MKDWIEGVVTDNIHWTEFLFSLRIEADVAPFKAGQFTSLALDIGGERIARPYSYLSSPGQQPVEFFFYAATGGVLSNALIKLQAGDRVWLKEHANGFFTLDEVPDARDLWLLGTGTGVAPFYSIARTPEPWQRFENVILVNAVRNGEDLQYLDLIDELRETHGDRFRFQAFVSREKVPGTLSGRIPAALADRSLETAVGLELTPEQSQIMLCGNPGMVADSIELLKQRGFRKNRRRTPGHLTTENYW
ncbi:MAG: ferredoxin--NADP reductase [Pseudomonadales bacterium]|nr:ferredoxin--NADP reductase [Pseudomonadales bacterium]